jgi:acylphosphatase
MNTIRLIITGTVQGVYYRQSAKAKATELHITGTVKNLQAGEVEIIATATQQQLDNFIIWCKAGPPKAVVTNIRIEELSVQLFGNFSIIR